MYQIDKKRELEVVDYTYEVWDWHTKKYVADITNIIQGSVSISWTLNDVEQMSFTVDLVQLQKKCELMGVEINEVLTPYVHDIRVRRNGDYILGVQVVETNVNIESETPTIDVKCTGFLNLFKDQIISYVWAGYSYAELARRIIEYSQKGDNLIKNGTIDIDTNGWLQVNGTMQRVASGSPQDYTHGMADLNCLMDTNGHWGTVATQLSTGPGVPVTIEFDGGTRSGVTLYIRERQAAASATGQRTAFQRVVPNAYNHYKVNYTTFYDRGYLLFEAYDTNNRDFWIDNIRVYRQDDNDSINDLKVSVDVNSVNTLAKTQGADRQRSYDLQNAKDALMSLTSLANDNFDFEFLPDRTFRVARRLGADKPEIEVSYPGNVESGSIERSAADLANKIRIIGSGIGDERVEITRANKQSRSTYGNREYSVTSNDVDDEGILYNNAVGYLWDMKDPSNLPSFTVSDGSINPGNVQIGDAILIKLYDNDYLETTTGMYRIVQYNLTISEENQETVDLTVQPAVDRPTPFKVRYIRDTINGNSQNSGNHWVRIKALRYNGKNGYTNIFELGSLKNLADSNPNKPDIQSNRNSEAASANWENIIWRTDDNSATYTGMNGGLTSVTIDLKKEYELDYIDVIHYNLDGRTYHHACLSVGTTLPDGMRGTGKLSTVLWDTDKAGVGYNPGEYVEMTNGRRSRYLQENIQNEVD